MITARVARGWGQRARARGCAEATAASGSSADGEGTWLYAHLIFGHSDIFGLCFNLAVSTFGGCDARDDPKTRVVARTTPRRRRRRARDF